MSGRNFVSFTGALCLVACFLSWLLVLSACSRSNHNENLKLVPAPGVGLRPLSPVEAISDFREIANYFRTLYGPMDYKQKMFKFSFENLVLSTEVQILAAKSDADIFAAYAKFVATFQDGHLGISFPLNSTQAVTYSVPLFVTPVGGSYLIADVGAELAGSGIANGDELVSIDGKTPREILDIILRYTSFATPESNQHLIFKAFKRDFYIAELVPTQNLVQVVVRKPTGRLVSEDLVWRVETVLGEKLVSDRRLGFSVPATAEIQNAAGQSLLTMAKPKPFFATSEVMKTYDFRLVTANEDFRKKFGLRDSDKPDIFAALFKFEGKTILIVRNFVYFHADFTNDTYMRGYKAILNQWESLADVLVLDQTHNGGGSYCEEFFRLFIDGDKDGFVQSLHVDRKWVVDLRMHWPDFISIINGTPNLRRLFEAMGSTVELAYDRGEKMTEPLPIIGGRSKVTPVDYTWKKPMLVLIDELAGSCGDAFPMLIKNNGVAKLFGRRTMGLGGNVEQMTLTNSQANLRMTRGLFTSHRDDGNYTPELWIENNGVLPDYPYEHTVDDYRKGFVGYVKEFSQKAIEQIH